jgi:purine nucleosidase
MSHNIFIVLGKAYLKKRIIGRNRSHQLLLHLRQAEIYLMGGYVFAPREGFPQWGHEIDFNMQIDIQSALYVIERSSPTFIPLAVSVETALRRTYLNKLKQSDSLARLIARQAEAFARDENFEAQYGQTCKGLPDDIVNFQHDSLACAIGLGWRDGVVIEEIH